MTWELCHSIKKILIVGMVTRRDKGVTVRVTDSHKIK